MTTGIMSEALQMAPLVIAHLLLGLALGTIFFVGLWRTLAGCRRPWLVALSSMARLALLGLILGLVGREGAAPLLIAGVGILFGRGIVLRRFRGAHA